MSYAHVGLLFLMTSVGTAIWTTLDHRKTAYPTLHEWLRLFVRVTLALTMVRYGVQKVMVVQMSPTSPHQLIAPFGLFTPRQLLWAFMGASPGYEAVTGMVEVLGGALLLLGRFTTLGALVTAAAMANVFLLNIFYDVEVKLFSFHLLLMACFLLLPDLPRLAAMLLFNRGTAPVERSKLFPRMRRSSLYSVAALAFVVASTVFTERSIDLVAGLPKAGGVPFYGIWKVEEFILDGALRPPLTSDELRWQRTVFEDRGYASIQRMSGTLIWAFTHIDADRKRISFDHTARPRPELRELFGPSWKAEFTISQSSPEALTFTVMYDNHPATLKLRLDHPPRFLSPHQRQWIRTAPRSVRMSEVADGTDGTKGLARWAYWRALQRLAMRGGCLC